MHFDLDDTEQKRADQFYRTHDPQCDIKYAIGGKYTYEFTPTGVGVIIRVRCVCGANQDVTNFDNW